MKNRKRFIKKYYQSLLITLIKEEFSTDYKDLKYVNSKKEMKKRWRQQLKFSSIANYDDLISQQENTYSNKKQMESMDNDRELMIVAEDPKEDIDRAKVNFGKTEVDKKVESEKKSFLELEKEARKQH